MTRLHIQEVSAESTSSIAEHDLSDLVPTTYPQGQSPSVASTSSNTGYFSPQVASHTNDNNSNIPRHPPRAIIYASSSSVGGHSSSSTQHPAVLIPTVSPPRYQLSLSHPGSPPSRAGTRFTSSTSTSARTRLREVYPPEARRTPPSPPRAASYGSAPTVLYDNTSIAGFDASWHTDENNAHHATSHATPRMPAIRRVTTLPEYQAAHDGVDDDDAYNQEGAEPITDEQHARITKGQYRLGIGYDDDSLSAEGNGNGNSGTMGKKISEQRKMERVRALEREFGRVKGDKRSASWNDSPHVKALKDNEGHKISSKSTHANDNEKGDHHAKHEQDDDGDDDDDEPDEKMSFKQLRIKAKEERNRLCKELGITKDGNLLTSGRKTRLALRWSQGLLGLIGVVTGLGGAFFTNPAKEDVLPPQGSISTWFLYIISLASLLCTLYLFTIQPFVRRRKSKKTEKNNNAHPNGMMPNGIVLPIFSSAGGGGQAYNAIGGGGKKQKGPFGKKGKKGYIHHQQQQPMMVNLLVDPSMLGGLGGGGAMPKPPSRYDDSGFDEDEFLSKTPKPTTKETLFNADELDDDLEEEDHDFAIPNYSAAAAAAARKRAASNNQPFTRMMDTMQIMKLQDKWREARRRMRRLALVDAGWSVVWGGESLFAIGYGGSCKPGTGNGWCDTYNMALASGVLLCVAFSTSFVFDILDLRRSRSTPRISRTV